MKHLYTILTLLLLCMAAPAAAQTEDYIIATLDFEDASYKGDGSGQATGQSGWSSLIAGAQYGDALLYGASGMGAESQIYWWADDNNTNLAHEMVGSADYGYAMWNGCHAISNYGSSDMAANSSYLQQLTVYAAAAEGDVRSGAGHNGSDNFAIHNGFGSRQSAFGMLPTLYFKDGVARVIDHMWVNNTTYFLHTVINGVGCPQPKEGDYVRIEAVGYDADGQEVATRAEFSLVEGADQIVTDWKRFDLSSLGKVTAVSFNIYGTLNNQWGLAAPAYFAYDDVAVRLEPSDALYTGISQTTVRTATAAVQAIYTIDGRRIQTLQPGVNIVRYADGTQKKVYVK